MLRTNLDLLHFIEQFFQEEDQGKNVHLKTFSAGNRLIEQGEKIRNVYIIKEGITKCFISEENGKDFIVEFLGHGEIVGELEALKKIDCLCNIAAISEVKAYTIPAYFFQELLEKNVVFNRILLQELSTRVIQTSSRASFQQLYTLEYGLQKLLSLQTDEQIAVSKDDMAAYLGIPVRSFNRTLKQLIQKGIISKPSGSANIDALIDSLK
ncbi:Crp/Fnr family transcriptional regulator [Pedobacter rhizosphaerae]|uniref:cAMP-binding domain of CRP or a regulatory subunit of cAMP-dependent protein kinases n=1 Tax=Pedobacter rhizosphaerae TaxID=390241 RepID=A0A1H9PVU8_9SPHI|nr:Crp/Fnr family transcriptional regulator [Pedobacter rhizosphaerae]SER51899.1 cAMP-binding domain of CRP or a regulatory subunit of cAMP-dependent protein kinases [Pedobacter rhizosphaerae]